MNMKTLLALVAVCGLAGSAIAQGDAERGEELAQTCAGCHGTDGNSTDPANPKLAGQNERYVIEQLQAYRDGDRVNALMQGFAADLSDEDMQDLAAFYAQQEPTFGEADPDMVELGRQIYRAGIAESEVMGCMGCHGPAGQGNAPAGFPALSGQHADYTVAQLEAYREGYRADEPSQDARMTDGQSQMMRSIAYRMRDFEMEAVASYIQGLH